MSNLKIKKIGISEIYQLQKISKETFIETFDAYNTVEDMQEYLNSKLSIEKLKKAIMNNEREPLSDNYS